MGTVAFFLQCLYLGWYQDDFSWKPKKGLTWNPSPKLCSAGDQHRKGKGSFEGKKKIGANTCCSNSQKWMNYFAWAHEHQSGKAAQTLWLRFRQLRGLTVGCVRILHVFCSQPSSLFGMQTACMHCGKLEEQTKFYCGINVQGYKGFSWKKPLGKQLWERFFCDSSGKEFLCGLERPELKAEVGEKLGHSLVSGSQKIKIRRV